MVYDTIPRVTDACFLSRMVFSAPTGAVHSLPSADVANSGLFVPLPTSSQGTRLGSLAAGDAGEREGCRAFAKVSNDNPLCQAAWGNLVSLWGCEEPQPNSACAEPHAAGTSSGSPMLQFAPAERHGGQSDHETRAGPESGPEGKLDVLHG